MTTCKTVRSHQEIGNQNEIENKTVDETIGDQLNEPTKQFNIESY